MSNLKVNTINDASGGSAAVLYGVASPPNSMGFRNRIINGDMRIDQRNAGASVTLSSEGYVLDRWLMALTQASKYSVQQNAGAVTPPAGFTNYLGVTSLSAYSIVSGDAFGIAQRIEGFNAADLAWGTASAQAVTISFWVRSSLTGTFGGSIRNGAFNRSYPFTYAISAANTWEYKTVTIPGDTSGTWATNNTTGPQILFGLGVGATFSGPAGAWAGSNFNAPTGATSVVGTNGATFYITGVQLEAGTVASPFERRDYGRELMMCQRYYEAGFFNTACNVMTLSSGQYSNATVSATPIAFKVTKRANPTVTEASVTVVTGGNWINNGVSGISSEFYTTELISNANTSNYANKSASYRASAEL